MVRKRGSGRVGLRVPPPTDSGPPYSARTTYVPPGTAFGVMAAAVRVPTVECMSTSQHRTRTAPAGATATTGRRRHPLTTTVRNVGIALDTAARVILLGRDGVRY
ncbi:hypothetical protein KPATCC21470_4124 [Kitasatospora purpeofusca]